MRGLVDCHVHTELSGHGTGTVAQIVGAAVFRGLTGLIFTEHLPLPDGLDPEHHISMPADKLREYADDVVTWAGRAHDLQVVLGAEADWIPGREAETAAVRDEAARVGVSVLLGSVHFLDGWAFDDPQHIAEWEGRDIDAVWERYFAVWSDAAKSGLFDVMAHPDLVKKFGFFPTYDPMELYVEAAQAAKHSRVIVEVSTAGLRKPVQELYPSEGFLRALREAGVSATVGSDAHQVSEVGQDIDVAYRALADAGFARVAFPITKDEVRYVEL